MAQRNLYFDNAATSWPKPETVYRAAEGYLRTCFGNPGRSGQMRLLEAERLIYRVRERTARFFNAGDPSRIIFALNATDALNMAIKGFVEKGDHIIFTAMEHNSVLRPLGGLRASGLITTTMVPCSREGFPDLDQLESAFRPRTRLVICTHASNVTGALLPVKAIAGLAHSKGACLLVDAAQSAGLAPIDLLAWELDMMAFAGHKGMLGPPGTGGLYVREGIRLKPWREGGTGSHSGQDLHPESMPELLEAGTMNGPGLAGLNEGIKFIEETVLQKIRSHEMAVHAYLKEKLAAIPGVNIYSPQKHEESVAVLSFTLNGQDCGELGYLLESSYGITCRTGLHCAPLAHRATGTFPQGTVRLSPGYFTTAGDVDCLVDALCEIALKKI